MIVNSLNTASSLLTWSNVVYVTGAVLTLCSAGMVLFEKRSKLKGLEVRWGFASELTVVVAAFISFAGTIGAIYFGNVVSHLKDVDLAHYQQATALQIAEAKKDTATANQNAHSADLEAKQTEQENATLRLQLQNHESAEQKTDTQLADANQKLNQFTQGLAAQQQGIAQQIQATPSLNDVSEAMIASQLAAYKGSDIRIMTMMDARSSRLANQFAQAFGQAGIKVDGIITEVGQDFHGVMVVVRNASPAPHPPLADALLHAVQSAGITVHPTADPRLPKDGEVALYIGPE